MKMRDAVKRYWQLSERWKCVPLRLDYDFQTRSGHLWLTDGHCVDMSAAVEAFTAIDVQVETIHTWSGDKPDTWYTRRGGAWEAHLPQRP